MITTTFTFATTLLACCAAFIRWRNEVDVRALGNLKIEVTQLRASVAQLQTDLRKANEDRVQLGVENQRLLRENGTLRAELETVRAKADTLAAQNEQQQKTIDTLTRQVADLQAAVARL